MAYEINRFNLQPLAVVKDGSVDHTTDIKLIGRNYSGYGEIQNENFVYLLENFSGENSPPRPISGQLWFDANQKRMNYYDGNNWRAASGAEDSENEPPGSHAGSLWWNTNTDQLYVHDGEKYQLIGPENIGPGTSRIENRTILDDTGVEHPALIAYTPTSDNFGTGQAVYIVSADEYNVNSSEVELYSRFETVKKGITLAEDDNTGDEYRLWGSADSAHSLIINGERVPASNMVVSGSGNTAVFDSDISISERILIGNAGGEGIELYSDGTALKIKNSNPTSDTSIDISLSNSGSIENVFTITPSGMFPFVDDYVDIGSSSRRIGQMYAKQFNGIATSAQYADLAEKYVTESAYSEGTVVHICAHDDHEMCTATANDIPAGVVSYRPAFLMNDSIDGQNIAIKGRVPVRVEGPVEKGQLVFVSSNGVCSTEQRHTPVGISLVNDSRIEERLVECYLKL